jgi:hypothetical protein
MTLANPNWCKEGKGKEGKGKEGKGKEGLHVWLTCQADFREVDAVGDHHEVSYTLGLRLLGAQIAGALFVFSSSAERGNSAAGLKVKARTSSHQVVGRGPVSQTKLLALL